MVIINIAQAMLIYYQMYLNTNVFAKIYVSGMNIRFPKYTNMIAGGSLCLQKGTTRSKSLILRRWSLQLLHKNADTLSTIAADYWGAARAITPTHQIK